MPSRDGFASNAAEHRRVGDAVAAQPVGAVHAARIFPGSEQSGEGRRAVGREHDAAHHVMRGWHHFDQPAREIESAIGAALDHSFELPANVVRPEMRHLQKHAALRRLPVLAHLGVDRPRNDVPRRAFGARIVALHEAIVRAVQQIAAGAAQAFFKYGSRHARARSGEKARRMKLNHLHVAERQARAQRHRHAVAALIARRRVIAVHRRPAAGRKQNGARVNEQEAAFADIDQQRTGDCSPVAAFDQFHGAVLFEARDVARPDLFGETVHDLDARQVALVHGAIERLAGERFLVNRAVGIAIEKTAELVFQLANAFDGLLAKRPGKILVGKPLAALQRVREMALDRIACCERDVVAALNHAGATAFAEQSLDGDRDRQRGICLVRVQRRKQSRAAGAQDQDVGR